MSAVDTAPAPLSEADHATQLRRAIVASTIGTTIEWYDFFLYSVVTGLVFAHLYFPGSDPLTGTLEAFGVYAVGFAARPVGAAIFGHWGDRIAGAYAYRSLLDSGAVLANGSDAPIEELDPLAGVHAGVRRTIDARDAWHPEQAVKIDQAFHATCVAPAWLARATTPA